jgi:hypothetical protein
LQFALRGCCTVNFGEAMQRVVAPFSLLIYLLDCAGTLLLIESSSLLIFAFGLRSQKLSLLTEQHALRRLA